MAPKLLPCHQGLAEASVFLFRFFIRLCFIIFIVYKYALLPPQAEHTIWFCNTSSAGRVMLLYVVFPSLLRAFAPYSVTSVEAWRFCVPISIFLPHTAMLIALSLQAVRHSPICCRDDVMAVSRPRLQLLIPPPPPPWLLTRPITLTQRRLLSTLPALGR